ncbi:nitric oxide dioxygenase [Nocardioides aurantiacus]|uniref:nitric oxide dioxygenase n=2 Tax=Nocardioides aurantiacus TaxID=86796 RepID=A0A3N2CU33_9ACTN|nr:nitric oxide dioxygenase [Nocardioides aurantiacus]
MLSTRSAAVVKATLPLVGAEIENIARVFYRHMFAARPDLERDLFNRGNQAQGDQQSALAGAIAVYATLLVADDGRDPVEVLARIAHKHASLGITEDQYLIVHEHLLVAIGEVLGDAVTPEVAAAWDEVYWHMAGALVTIENRLYADAGVAHADVWRTLVLRRCRQESPDTVSFMPGAADHSVLPPARPGQYVSVQVTLPDGARQIRQIRQYSLTGSTDPQEWGIRVKAAPPGRAVDGTTTPAGQVSNVLHDNLIEGRRIRASMPFGELVLEDSDRPLVLISAGIGATPIFRLLRYLAGAGSARDALVLHAVRSPAQHAHRRELKELVAAMPTASLHRWYKDLGVRPTRDALQAGRVDLAAVELHTDAQVYLCGPLPFMEAVRASLINDHHVVEADVHYEVFGPDTWLASA